MTPQPERPDPADPSARLIRRVTIVAASLFALFCLWFAFLWVTVLRALPEGAPPVQTALALVGLTVSLGGAALMGYVLRRTVAG